VCLLGRFPALAGADLQSAAGRSCCSPANGAGKSTLLRVLAGLLTVHRGEAEVLGADLRSATERRSVRRRLALVGHDTFCYDDLTVAENLRFAARASGRPDRGATAALARFGLTGLETSGTAACPRVSAAACPSPSPSTATRSSSCSTSPTPASTRVHRTELDLLVAAAPGGGGRS